MYRFAILLLYGTKGTKMIDITTEAVQSNAYKNYSLLTTHYSLSPQGGESC